jgi:hypothetical protein
VEGEEGSMKNFGSSSMNKGKSREENGYGVEDLLEDKNLEQNEEEIEHKNG